MNKKFLNINKKGVSLIETLVAISVFVLIALSVYQVYVLISNSLYTGRLKVTSTALANEQFEIIRNMPFSDVGIVDGVPDGILEATRVFVRDGVTFNVNTYVRNRFVSCRL
jgi:prepilin-type N-terminal cleavage/methylation domain-containing protein